MSETFENELITCLAQYSAVFSSHIVDYFITLSWLQLPSEWRDFLTKLNSDQCFELLKAHRFSGLPASLHEFFNRCESLTIEHSPYWRDHPHTVTLPLPRELVLGNKKKRHEVSMLAKLITDMCRQHECPWVVDLGAGLYFYMAFPLMADSALQPDCRIVLLGPCFSSSIRSPHSRH